MKKKHTFHIPVMGIGFTIDTPLKVSCFGIDSAISIVDDNLLERFREKYCNLFQIPYSEITHSNEDYRAERITSYLNLINELAEQKFEELKSATIEKRNDIIDYLKMFPESSILKEEFNNFTEKHLPDIKNWFSEKISRGSIDVNIMTKIDKVNYSKGEKLPIEFNDAHSALRGFANSNLESSVILSAGMSPRLYSYIEKFNDFFPDKVGNIKKQIVLKVSDYRSALIQGKFLAKKGLWVSEYRIESGLNCGGHAFVSSGNTMGPILSKFRDNRNELIKSVYGIFIDALAKKNKVVPEAEMKMRITAQGGVGTAEEHEFLLDHYKVDSVGWGSPFLLAPDVTNIDEDTVNKLVDAAEDDLYLSNISPLGVPFNSLRTNTLDLQKNKSVEKGNPGSHCTNRYLVSNTEFTDKPICTASVKYQKSKIEELKNSGLSSEDFKRKVKKIVEKSCICVGLGNSALLANNLNKKDEPVGVSVCPGPNLAYFDKKTNLKEMIDHIYGRTNIISRNDRPNMFVKELNLYIDQLKTAVSEAGNIASENKINYLEGFSENLFSGVDYYLDLFNTVKGKFQDTKAEIIADLNNSFDRVTSLAMEIKQLKTIPVSSVKKK